MVGKRLSILIKGQINRTEVLAPSISSDNENFIALDIVNYGGIITLRVAHVTKRSMTVTTDDKRETLGLGSKLLVHIDTKVSKRDNAVDLGLVANLPDSLLHFSDGVQESSLVSNAGDSRRGISSHTNNRQIMILEDLVVLNGLVQSFVLALDITRDDRESQVLQKLAKLLITTVPLVVSERHGIKVELIQGLCNLGGSVEGVEQCALELVARIEPQVVRVVLSQSIDCVLNARIATEAALLGVDAVCA